MKTQNQLLWLALAYQCLIRAGDSPVQAEATIGAVMDSRHIARSRLNAELKHYAEYLTNAMPIELVEVPA